MKLNPTAIPQGTRTYLFEEAANKRFLEQTLHAVFRSRGFQEIVTPLIEYNDSAVVGLTEPERNRIIRFTEGDSGRIIALRADITSQVARSAATVLSGRPLPHLLCYTGSVFRRARKGHGEQYVLNQAGLEIIGHAGPEADVETVRAVSSALKAVGLEGCTISISHAGFIASFLEGLNDDDCQKVKRALGKKDKTSLKEILGDSRAEKTVALAGLYGGGEVLDKAGEIADSSAGKTALDNLKAVYRSLEESGIAEKISIDLSEMRGFGYYTGVNLELFSASGIPLGTGGRYDNLVKRFGPDLPAVGFGFDVDGLMDALKKENRSKNWQCADVLMVGGTQEDADLLRNAGLMVSVPFIFLNETDANGYAQKMDIPNILLSVGGGTYRWVKNGNGKESLTPQAFLQKFLSGE